MLADWPKILSTVYLVFVLSLSFRDPMLVLRFPFANAYFWIYVFKPVRAFFREIPAIGCFFLFFSSLLSPDASRRASVLSVDSRVGSRKLTRRHSSASPYPPTAYGPSLNPFFASGSSPLPLWCDVVLLQRDCAPVCSGVCF